MAFFTKYFASLTLFLAFQPALFAADTAYTALRAYGKQNGADSLKHIVELRGRAGAPEPETWKITILDGGARGGIRELEIRHGRVVSERTPVGRETGEPMNFSQLNLDSDGVFTIINQETQKLNVAFDHVDYTLHAGVRGGAPVWDVDLFDGRNGRVCTMEIAADSGTILHKDVIRAQNGGPDTSGDHVYVQEQPRAYPGPGEDGDTYYEENHSGGGVNGFFGKVKRHFEKRGRQFENFFTGRGWTDR